MRMCLYGRAILVGDENRGGKWSMLTLEDNRAMYLKCFDCFLFFFYNVSRTDPQARWHTNAHAATCFVKKRVH